MHFILREGGHGTVTETGDSRAACDDARNSQLGLHPFTDSTKFARSTEDTKRNPLYDENDGA